MSAEVVAVVLQRTDQPGNLLVSVKIACEEEGSFHAMLCQYRLDNVTTVREFVSCEDEVYHFLRGICAYDAAGVNDESILLLLAPGDGGKK